MCFPNQTSEIAQFFEGRSVLLTGATGFVGKAILEKIIRSCPKIATVFILIRPKSGSDVNARLEKLLDNVLFESIKVSNPSNILKIVPISGDISLPALGISDEDHSKLCGDVSVVLHSAASTNFNGNVKNSFNINVKGASRLVDLSKKMPKLVAFVHISTAYANCERLSIDEIVYPMSAEPKALEQLLDEMSNPAVEASRMEIFDGKKNTYVFTKSVLECLMDQEKYNIPVCIVRPSIVASAYHEPIPGWLEADHGYILPGKLFARGLGRTGHARADIKMDCVPVDFLASFVLAAAWELGASEEKTMRLYNYCSSSLNPATAELGRQLANKLVLEFPISGGIWYPHLTIWANSNMVDFIEFFQVVIPACGLDAMRFLIGKKPKFLSFYQYYRKLRLATKYFRMNEWKFQTENMTKLYNKMSAYDQEAFNFRVQDIDWEHFARVGFAFGRKHILKENEKSLEKARTRLKILTFAHRSVQFFGIAFVVLVLAYLVRVIFALN